MCLIAVLAMIAVIVAIAVDLFFGWNKAKQRGDARSSYAFSRTISKFALYEGVMIIAFCIDMLVHFVWAQLNDTCYFAPIICCIVAIVLCIVEIWSMREKADEKTRNNLHNAIKIIAEAIPKDQVADFVKNVIEAGTKEKDVTES